MALKPVIGGFVDVPANSGGIPEAPNDGNLYGRKSAAWSEVSLSGLVEKTTTVNGHALSGNVSVTSSDVGLGNCNNTSDANKPISTATQTALDAKASKRVYQTASFTAAAYGRYHVNGSATADGSVVVSDPNSPTTGDIYDCVIVSGFVRINGVDYAASRFPIEREWNGSAWTTLAPAGASKVTPVDADSVLLVDSASGNTIKNITWTNLKGAAKTYFDGLYAGQGAAGTTYFTQLATNSTPVYGSTTLQNTPLTLTLSTGTYRFEAAWSTTGTNYAVCGSRPCLVNSGNVTVYVGVHSWTTYASAGPSSGSGAIINEGVFLFGSSGGLTLAGKNQSDVYTVLISVSGSTTITLQVAQAVASGTTAADGVAIAAGSYIFAQKVQ